MTRDDVFERDAVLDRRAFVLQASFRALLDAMARPGEVSELPRADEQARADALAAGLFASTVTALDVLLDAATSLAVAGPDAARAERSLTRRTHALRAPLPEAPYAVLPLSVPAGQAAETVSSLSPGTLLDPHLGATCVVECGALLGTDARGGRVGSVSGDAPARGFRLRGPGIRESALLACDRPEALVARSARGDEFPCGIDLVLVDRVGHVAAIPRTTAIEEVGTWAM